MKLPAPGICEAAMLFWLFAPHDGRAGPRRRRSDAHCPRRRPRRKLPGRGPSRPSSALQAMAIRAGEWDPRDPACIAPHCMAAPAPVCAVQLTDRNRFGAFQTLIAPVGGPAGERFGTAARRLRRRVPSSSPSRASSATD